MRDAGHRMPDAGHRTSDGEKSKNNISTPQGGGHNHYKSAKIYKIIWDKSLVISSDLRFVSNILRFLTILYTDIRNTGYKVSPRC